MIMQDCRQCTTMTEQWWREASACLPCAVQCTTMIECMPLHMAQSNAPRRSNACRFTWRSPMAPRRPNAGVESETASTREGCGTTHTEPAVRALPTLLFPWGCTPSSPAFLHRGENGHFLLIPHIPQKGSFDSLNLERHLTFRLSSPIGRFSFPVFPDVLKGFPFFARSIIESMFCVSQSRPAS